jgi:short-subunit dehydrogenase
MATPSLAAYAKPATAGFPAVLAAEVASHGISVSSLEPDGMASN